MFDMIFSRLRGEWSRSFVAEKLFKNKRVLDVGCGTGSFLEFDRDNFVGIDINDEVLKICKDKGLNVKKAGVSDMPFKAGEFDGVNCQQVIEHLVPSDAFSMMSESARVLKKGGLLVISTEMVTKRFWNTFSHIRPYPPKAIMKLLNPSGQETFEKLSSFEVVSVDYSGVPFKNGLLYLLSTLVAHFLGVGRINYTMVLRKL